MMRAAQEFADAVAQHARRQFEEGRQTLAEVKRSLRRYAVQTLLRLDEILTGLGNDDSRLLESVLAICPP